MRGPTRIGIVVSRRSDLTQCVKGLERLALEESAKVVKLLPIMVLNSHWRHRQAVRFLRRLVKLVDCLIVATSDDPHLPAMIDAILRRELHDDRVRVIAVALSGWNHQATRATVLSMESARCHQMILRFGRQKNIGGKGFSRACAKASVGIHLNYTVMLTAGPKPEQLSLRRAIKIGRELKSGVPSQGCASGNLSRTPR
ncbi:hypothetical protein EPO05_02470 [Patescibacteria group bacterium]|nr:MAG: hypothetical protein EPO05_02470 [Patescibacteria group bacterium]